MYGLNTNEITSHILEQYLDSSENENTNNNNNKSVERFDDVFLIHQLKWLSFDESQSFEIIKQSNRLIRRFICMLISFTFFFSPFFLFPLL